MLLQRKEPPIRADFLSWPEYFPIAAKWNCKKGRNIQHLDTVSYTVRRELDDYAVAELSNFPKLKAYAESKRIFIIEAQFRQQAALQRHPREMA